MMDSSPTSVRCVLRLGTHGDWGHRMPRVQQLSLKQHVQQRKSFYNYSGKLSIESLSPEFGSLGVGLCRDGGRISFSRISCWMFLAGQK